ncbi:hypothetical protein [Caballeronia sordidicola]|nr:hypothetical protein [Caballeronia sordidicola]
MHISKRDAPVAGGSTDKPTVIANSKLDIDVLRRVAEAAPSGRWSVWTSNSWRRVFADQRGKHVSVVEPTTQGDGHADLLFGAGVATYLESFPAEVALELLDELVAARAANADLFGLLERAHRAIDLLLAQMIMAAPDFRVTQSVVWLDVVAVAEALGRKPS